MKYNVPKSFELGGQKITVKFMRTIPQEGAVGVYKHFENSILIQTHLNDTLIAKSRVEQTFWHEYAHALYDACRKDELSANEDLVDITGEFLYQSLGKKTW